jgi:PAS domain S-box-containing protein
MDDPSESKPMRRTRTRAAASAAHTSVEHAQATEALRHSEERFRTAFEDGAVPMALTAADGTFLDLNSAFCQMLGYTKADLIGRSIADVTYPPDLDANRAAIEQVIRGATSSFRMEKRYLRQDGSVIWGDLSTAFVRDAGGTPIYMVTHVQDITQRKQAEESLRRINAELEERVAERTAEVRARARQLQVLAGELTRAEERERRRLAVILHDHLQQLLAAAKMRAGMAIRQIPLPAAQQELIQIETLLDQCIDASRSLTAELSPPVLYDGGLLLALEWLGRWMQEKHRLRVAVDTTAAAEPTGEEIKVFLFQAARELLWNVVKHAGVPDAKLTLAVEGDRLRLCVEDRGRGFDPATVQPRPGDTAVGGFGLFSVRERLELLGGSMTIDSAPGRGTRVTLGAPPNHFPAADPAASAPPGRADPTGHPREHGSKMRVLLADDHTILRQGLAALLKRQADMELVGQAADGQEAVDLTHALRPDVVVMDLTMPKLNGIEATQRITAESPGVQVIGLSMHAGKDFARRMSKAGAVAYLSKGGPMEELLAAIRACRSRARAPA